MHTNVLAVKTVTNKSLAVKLQSAEIAADWDPHFPRQWLRQAGFVLASYVPV